MEYLQLDSALESRLLRTVEFLRFARDYVRPEGPNGDMRYDAVKATAERRIKKLRI